MSIPREGSCDIGNGIIVSRYPDWCKVPDKPIPFSIYAKQDEDANTAATVRMTGKRSHTFGSLTTCCHGDEAGIGLGVKSGTKGSVCQPKTWSKTVRIEGKYVVRHNDEWWMNNKNTTGKLCYVKDTEVYDPTTPFLHTGTSDKSKEDKQEREVITVSLEPPTGLPDEVESMYDFNTGPDLKFGDQIAQSAARISSSPRTIARSPSAITRERIQSTRSSRYNQLNRQMRQRRRNLQGRSGAGSNIEYDELTVFGIPLPGFVRTRPVPDSVKQAYYAYTLEEERKVEFRYWMEQYLKYEQDDKDIDYSKLPLTYGDGMALVDQRPQRGGPMGILNDPRFVHLKNKYAPYPYGEIRGWYNNLKDTWEFKDQEDEVFKPEDLEILYANYAEEAKRPGLLMIEPQKLTASNVRVSEKESRERRLEGCGIRPHRLNKTRCGRTGKQSHHGIPDFTLRTGTQKDSKARAPGTPSYEDALTICIPEDKHYKLHSFLNKKIAQNVNKDNTISWGKVREYSFESLDEYALSSVGKICLELYKIALQLQFKNLEPTTGKSWFYGGDITKLRGLTNHSEDNPNVPMMKALSEHWGFKFPW